MSTRKATNITNRPFSPRLSPALAVGVALLVCSTVAPGSVAAQDTTTTQCPSAYCMCGSVVKGKVVFMADLQCPDTSGLIVGASNTTIDLNGFRLQCAGMGFHQSCQGTMSGPEPDIGINTAGCGTTMDQPCSNVTIKGSGSIVGFDKGVRIKGPAKNILVEKVNVSGPDAVGGFFTTLTQDRPTTQGIFVENILCPDPLVVIRRNSVDNHTDGIQLNAAHCVVIQDNFLHDNNPGSGDFSPGTSHAINLANSANATINNNLVVDNGINQNDDAGIVMDGTGTTGNIIANNLVSYNNGDGILAINGATANRIANNNLVLNTSTEPTTPTTSLVTADGQRVFYDLAERGTGANQWNTNNRCETESTTTEAPSPPAANVCNPGEATDPLKR